MKVLIFNVRFFVPLCKVFFLKKKVIEKFYINIVIKTPCVSTLCD